MENCPEMVRNETGSDLGEWPPGTVDKDQVFREKRQVISLILNLLSLSCL